MHRKHLSQTKDCLSFGGCDLMINSAGAKPHFLGQPGNRQVRWPNRTIMKTMNNRTIVTSILAVATVAASFAGVVMARHAQQPAPQAKVGPVEAIHNSLEKVPGVPFSATLEFDEGKWGYDVIVIHDHKASEIEVNAMTGKVGDVEDAVPADEASELKADLEAAIKKAN